jgi:UDP-glucose 4-epimerase
MILVVGGAGFIGSHVLKLLRISNEPHLVFDNLIHGHQAAIQDSELVLGDLASPSDLKQVFESRPEIDVVMHFAAYISVGESVREPAKYYRNNFVGMLNLVEAMREHQVDKIVFSSTAAVYGVPQRIPLHEEHPTLPINPYGHSKLMAEQLLRDMEIAHSFHSVCLRYFNAAGSDPTGVLGEDHDPEEHLIPNVLLSAMGKKPTLKVFGDDYPTPDGTCVRDYIHVEDLADAHLLAVKHLREKGDSRTYNLGNGRGYSIKEVLDTAIQVTGKDIPYEVGPKRLGDSPELVADASRIRADWGWTPKRPDLIDIVADAWRWRLAHPDGYSE